MKALSLVALSLVASFGVLAACSSEAQNTNPPPAAVAEGGAPAADAGATSPLPTTSTTDAKGQFGGSGKSNGQTGRFVYQLSAPENPAFAPYVDGVVKSEIVVNSINAFSNALTIPNDIPVVAGECGQVNAYYDPQEHLVGLCFELIHAIHTQFSSKLEGKTPAEQMDVTARAWAFIALHELGHALIGENKIGVLGGEEDVVDDISGLIFVAAKIPEVPLWGTGALRVIAPDAPTYSGEHSFSSQRYFNMLCMVYGSDPTAYAELVGAEEDSLLPQERAVRCPKEYADKQKAAEQLFAPYVRE